MAHTTTQRTIACLVVACVFTTVCVLPTTFALYEDQLGENDWLRQHVGAVTAAAAVGKRLFVGTASAVVACLNVRTGSLTWRQVLQPGDVVDAILLHKRRLLTVSSCGKQVRLWYAPTGELVWDAVLPVSTAVAASMAVVDPHDVEERCGSEPPSVTWVNGVDGNLMAAVTAGNTLYVLNAGDGSLVATWKPSAAQQCTITAIHSGDPKSGELFATCGTHAFKFNVAKAATMPQGGEVDDSEVSDVDDDDDDGLVDVGSTSGSVHDGPDMPSRTIIQLTPESHVTLDVPQRVASSDDDDEDDDDDDDVHVAAVVSTPSAAHGMIVAYVNGDGGINIVGVDTSTSTSVSASDLGGNAARVRVETGGGAVIVALEDGRDAVVALTEGSNGGEASVDADGSTAVNDGGADDATTLTASVTDVFPPVATGDRVMSHALSHDGVTYVATAEVNDRGVLLKVASTSTGSVETTQVLSAEVGMDAVSDTGYGDEVRMFLFPYTASKSSSRAVGHRALLVTETDTIAMLQLGRDASPVWVRDEAMAEPVAAEVVDSGDHIEARLGRHDSDEEDEVLDLSFGARLASQLSQAKSTVAMLMEAAKDPKQFLVSSGASRAAYRANKTIVVLTRAGVLFGVDSITGATRWSRSVAPPLSSTRLLVTRRRMMATHPPEVLVLQRHDSRAVQYEYFNAETGAQSGDGGVVRVAPGDLRLASRIHEHDATHRQLVLLVDSAGMLTVLPETHGARSKFEHLRTSFVFSVADPSQSVVTGYSVVAAAGSDPTADGALDTTPVWSVVFPPGESIVTSTQTDMEDPVHTPARILGDQSLLIKYLNPNLLVVATANDGVLAAKEAGGKVVPSVSVHVIDAVSGRTLEARTHRGATPPMNVLMHENWVQYTYWNHKTKVQEFVSLVLYEGSVGPRDLSPLKPPEDTSGDFTSYHAVDPLVSAQSFVLPTPVQTMAVTRTAASITHRWLLMGTESGALWTLDRRIVDPRRPLEPIGSNDALKREGLAQYQPHIPLMHSSFASYNLTVDRIEFIVSAPTALESTSVVAAVGLDLFATRVHPSKEFDILSSDFNKQLLIMMSCGLAFATFAAHAATKRRELNDAWK